ncbi:hypothetical protein L9F63_000639, partial [Diploptera punctata]
TFKILSPEIMEISSFGKSQCATDSLYFVLSHVIVCIICLVMQTPFAIIAQNISCY